MNCLGLLVFFLFAICVFGAETDLYHVTACGKSFTLLPKKLSNELKTESVAANIKFFNTTSIEDCVENCCKWENCNFAVQVNRSCYNVYNPYFSKISVLICIWIFLRFCARHIRNVQQKIIKFQMIRKPIRLSKSERLKSKFFIFLT